MLLQDFGLIVSSEAGRDGGGGWTERPRMLSHQDLYSPGFWSLLATARALLSCPGAVGDRRWQRFGEMGLV